MTLLVSRIAAARLLLAATALTIGGASLAAGAPEVIGINAAVLNNVRIRPGGATVARTAVVRQRVALADEVQTGGRSQLQVLLLDRSTFTVGANARLTIDRFVYDPARGARSVGASVVKGAFRFMSGRPDAKGSSSIRTPVATIGIRGTIVDGVVGEDAVRIAVGERGVGPGVRSDPATASLIILRGPGRGAQGRVQPGIIDVSSGGRTVTVDLPMRAVYVPRPGAAPIGPFVISPEGLRAVQALIFPSLAPRFGLAPEMAGQPYYPVQPTTRPRPPGGPDYLEDSAGGNPTGYPTGYAPQGPGSYIPTIPQGMLETARRPQRSAPTGDQQTPAPTQTSGGENERITTQKSTPTPTPVPTQVDTPVSDQVPAPASTSGPNEKMSVPTPTPAPPAPKPVGAPAPGPNAQLPAPTPMPTPTPKPVYAPVPGPNDKVPTPPAKPINMPAPTPSPTPTPAPPPKYPPGQNPNPNNPTVVK